MNKKGLCVESATGSLLKDVILGGQDGLVNVLGLTLGVAAATLDPRIVIIAGLAGTMAESISMAAVAYTSTKAACDFYARRLEEEQDHLKRIPAAEEKAVRHIYVMKGFRGSLLQNVVRRITSSKKVWLDTLMAEELKLFPEEYDNPVHAALVVGCSSLLGSLIPLLPFFFLAITPAIVWSLFISAAALFVTGAVKAKLTIGRPLRSGVEMMGIGMIAALIGFLIGRWLGVNV